MILKKAITIGMLSCVALAAAVSAHGQPEPFFYEDFSEFTAGIRINNSNQGGGGWTSTSQAIIGNDPEYALTGGKYLEIRSSAANQTASRAYDIIPTSGVYWFQVTFFNNVLSSDQSGTSMHPTIQLRTQSNSAILGIYLREGRENIEVGSRENSEFTFNDTGVSWETKDWNTITFEIDATNEVAKVFINDALVLQNLSIAGNAALDNLYIGGNLPTAETSLIVDNFAFYTGTHKDL